MENLNEQPEIRNFGKDCRKIGYEAGYTRAMLDDRRRRLSKERTMRNGSNAFLDWLDDLISSHAKRR